MNIQENISLKKYTTFGVEVSAKYFAEVFTVDDIKQLLRLDVWKNNKRYILGGGSNLLFTDDFDGLIVKSSINGHATISEQEDTITVKVGAGVDWHTFVIWSAENNYWGIENLALIPGTVGASPVQNIGAYGVEARDVVVSVSVIDIETGEEVTLENVDCNFGYRDSLFKQLPEKYIVTHVVFLLSKIPILNLEYGAITQKLAELNITDPSALDMAETIMKIRLSKLPKVGEVGMAGSFFKNPIIDFHLAEKLKEQYPDMPQYVMDDGKIKLSAGWLIDTLGYKGVQEGNVGTYYKHALVLVNYGNATGLEVWKFAQGIIDHIKREFEITLEPEVIVL